MASLVKRMQSFTSTQGDEDLPIAVPANTHKSIRKLMAGNDRYLRNATQAVQDKRGDDERNLRRRLSSLGQNPWAIMVSCSDSRCPVERVFDASPGDLFVVRVAGNICGSPIGGVIGSAEYAVEHLKSPLLMVLGHTKCGAVSAAVRCSKDCIAPGDHFGRNLGAVVGHIRNPALEALESADRPSTPEQIELAIELNVYHSMEQILRWSTAIQETVREGVLEIHGGIYDITTGKVTFLGQHPRQREILDVARTVTVRTGADAPMPAPEALLRLQKGNSRYVIGDVDSKIIDTKVRHALVQKGQRPLAVMLGCADSRIPIDYVFDTNPGDLFVVRNAGSACGAIAGGLIGSIEYGIGHLKTQLLVVLGHTQCGAVAAAMEAHLANEKKGEEAPEGLRKLLELLEMPVKMAVDQSGSTALADRVSLAIELNVWHTIEQLLANSTVLQGAVTQGILQIHGAIYDLQTGRVRFMGEHPQLKKLVHQDVDLDVETTDNGWNRDTSCGTQSTAATARPGPKQVAAFDPVGIVPDGSRKAPTAAWGDDEEPPTRKPSQAENDGKWFELSWYVQTKHGRQHLKDVVLDQNNWIAGVIVALVSVPLSISLGIASGTTPIRGLATAIFGGLCAGIFGSSDYNIVGPAGALSGMLMSYAVKYGEDVLPWLSLISAVICALCALLRLDTFMLMLPKSVFEGFTVGVALIIGLNQINLACGLTPGKKHALFIMNIIESVKTLGETQPASLIVFLLQAPALWFLMRKIPKIPWTVIFPVVSIPLGVLCDGGHLGFDLLTLKSKYGMLKPEEIVQPLRSCDASFLDMLFPSFSIAVVAVMQTLISARTAAGRVDRDFSELGELRGLVLSHAVCGLTGAMPPAGVFGRTSLNTSLGATHRFSQTLNAIVVALIALALMPIFSYLPQATIAAILVVAAIRMAPTSSLLKLWGEDRGALALCAVTALICVGGDPAIGLAAGMVMALLASARTMLSAPFVDIRSKPSGDKRSYHVAIQGAVTYVNAETFMERAQKLENASEISMDLSGVRQVDHDGITLLGRVAAGWVKSEPDCRVWIKGVNSKIHPALSKFEWFTRAEDNGRVQMA